MGTAIVLSVHQAVLFPSLAASATSLVACLGGWVLCAIFCSLGMLHRMSSIAAACRGTGGELGSSTRCCLAWVATGTPLFTISASLYGLAMGFSTGSAVGGIYSSVRVGEGTLPHV